ncbi:hypothetical protein [Mesorhizobium sp. B2-4-8]|uniref:hypothetical protein n=1 Tax=Mesorhizobium sp. B2-4-8 TaxID=2589941 RepID=UPI00112E6A3E|nr:hypothetical protein [Mesorhizobium sp. B2-4-8]TPL36763.1 hypothetical protein FJ947_10960 [Mesorhizobium sp. B2-4-8]
MRRNFLEDSYVSNATPSRLFYLLAGASLALFLPSLGKRGARRSAHWRVADVERHHQKAETWGWLPFFEKAAQDNGFRSHELLAIASRETNVENIKGDYVNGVAQGYGVMQIDIKSYPDFIRSGDWSDPEKNIQKGAEVLAEKKAAIVHHYGKSRTVGRGSNQLSYIGATLTDLGLLRTSLAAYNCGEWAHATMSIFGDPDRITTQGDYSTDVMNRTEVFDRLA